MWGISTCGQGSVSGHHCWDMLSQAGRIQDSSDRKESFDLCFLIDFTDGDRENKDGAEGHWWWWCKYFPEPNALPLTAENCYCHSVAISHREAFKPIRDLMMAGLGKRENKNECFSNIALILDGFQNHVCVHTHAPRCVCAQVRVLMEAIGNFRGPPLGAVHLVYLNSLSLT